jgi:hypothetical protein
MKMRMKLGRECKGMERGLGAGREGRGAGVMSCRCSGM